MNPEHYLNLVAGFHQAFRYCQPAPTAPVFTEGKLRINLIEEEYVEYATSVKRVDKLDALCDLQYVVSGAVLALGLRDKFLAMMPKPHGAFPQRQQRWMQLWVSAFANYVEHENANATTLALVNLQDSIELAVYEHEFSKTFDAACDAVHANNIAKLWTWSEVAEYQWKSDIDGTERLRFELTINGLFIARRADGKIIKPARHKLVDLTPFV